MVFEFSLIFRLHLFDSCWTSFVSCHEALLALSHMHRKGRRSIMVLSWMHTSARRDTFFFASAHRRVHNTIRSRRFHGALDRELISQSPSPIGG